MITRAKPLIGAHVCKGPYVEKWLFNASWMMGSKKCGGRRVITSVFVRCGDVGLDIVREGGLVGEPGDGGIDTERFGAILMLVIMDDRGWRS